MIWFNQRFGSTKDLGQPKVWFIARLGEGGATGPLKFFPDLETHDSSIYTANAGFIYLMMSLMQSVYLFQLTALIN